MEKLAILLLVAAVLMSAQALTQEKRPKEMIKFLSKRKSYWSRWWEGECKGWSNGCRTPSDCCSNICDGTCELTGEIF
uniref:Conotoxin superfamily O2 n=1 Tax=Conus ermineus TaxID=55423 RepID=A0A346CJK1_CONER|nr:conotoxin precursor superfamily O2 [Conus ermineus]